MSAALQRFFFPTGSAHGLALLRILVGLYAIGLCLFWLALPLPEQPPLAVPFVPRALAALLPSAPPHAVVRGLEWLALVLGMVFVSGRAFRWVGPAFALLMLGLATLDVSIPARPSHKNNLLVLHLLVLAAAPSADALVFGFRRRLRRSRRSRGQRHGTHHTRYGWPLRLLQVLVVITYVLAALTKLRVQPLLAFADGSWLAAQLRQAILVERIYGSGEDPILAWWLLGHPLLLAAGGIGAMLIEGLAPLALLSRLAGRLWSLSAWAFHWGVLGAMGIYFPFQLLGIAYACFLLPLAPAPAGAEAER